MTRAPRSLCMILSDGDILDRLEAGDLVIEPIEDIDLQVQPASVDVRLGREFLEFQRANIPSIHPTSENETEDYTREAIIDDGREYILHPGDFVLATTKERVEIPPDLVAQVEGRSSLGRLAVITHASLPVDEEIFIWTPESGFGFHEIGDVVEDEPEARAVSFDPETLSVSTHEITDYITNPVQRIYEVTLKSGRQVRVTADHNLFTLDEWGEVTRVPSEEAVDEHVLVPGTVPAPRGEERQIDLVTVLDGDEDIVIYASDGVGSVDWSGTHRTLQRHYEDQDAAPLTRVRTATIPGDAHVGFKQGSDRLPRHLPVTPEFGWMLGFYVAEGYARRKQVVFTNNDDERLERVASYFEQFDTCPSWQRDPDGASRLTVCSALWSAVIRAIAGAGGEKVIPDRAWNWDDAVLEAVYDGLLEGDGHRRSGRDTLYTANEEHADRAMYLGERLDRMTSAYHRLRDVDDGADRDEWSVDFYRDAHKRGQYVPNPSALLRQLRAEAGLTTQEAATAIGRSSGTSISNVENREYETVTRETLRDLRSAYREHGAETGRLDAILDDDVRFERVESVERTDREEVTYDLEVRPNGRPIENFLGGRGGIFLSNTAGFVDPGFRGRITLELSNLGTAPVALSPGMRIAQLVFTELKTPARKPYGSERNSKYQDQTGPEASRIQGDEEFTQDQ
ncbi:deoxycytidine triphosphate deaminase [Halanaeroarchaeum sulfurireducens]|uniref:Deoxycytidine triphosphate deaminase n=1 Tax=Halanaeroarchaeum sulfurireducens TaxID=1604004 RepID=A0A0N9N8U9_9EURY|nr:deoxycytidine triphosphate deaminase [Halanaeroarchaeum sulfurireducens]